MMVRIPPTAWAAVLQWLVDRAGADALIKAYTAPIPAVGGAPPSGCTLLGTLTAATPLGGVDWDAWELTFSDATPDLLVDADGEVAWLRVESAAGLWVADLDVTATGGGGAVETPSTQLYQGGTLSLASAVLRLT